MRRGTAAALAALACMAPAAATAQPREPAGRVLERIWAEAMDSSQVRPLAQVLLDSIGPRLTGSPGQLAAQAWVAARYGGWGVAARQERYGSWRGWRRGITHADLLQPRTRALEAQLDAWSAGTRGPVTAEVLVLPERLDTAGFRSWLRTARGKFVLASAEPPSCRPQESWIEGGGAEAGERSDSLALSALRGWARRVVRATGESSDRFPQLLEAGGVAAILRVDWTGGWGTSRVHAAPVRRTPVLNVACEDYGLLFRLARAGQRPVLRLAADAEFVGQVPARNTLAELRGRERAGEYVMLSAHLDSWDGASGATDNGSGTVVMMEAMRILRKVYPDPRRTILAAHWGGEEQGLNGSRAFVEDHPAVVRNLAALFNQDSGTGRIASVSLEGFVGVGARFRSWLARVPAALTDSLRVDDPGAPGLGMTDHAAFVCAGAPAFNLSSRPWNYGAYTWHTNRDTFDKLSFHDLRRNAALVAMLVYLASEEPEPLPREQAVAPRVGEMRVRVGACSRAARAAPAEAGPR